MVIQSTSSQRIQDRIAKITLRLAADKNVAHVTSADVVKEGVPRATMRRYIPTEEALWQNVVAFIEKQMSINWSAVSDIQQSYAEKLHSLLAVQVGLIRSMPVLRSVLFSHALQNRDEHIQQGLSAIRARFSRVLEDTLLDGVRAGEFVPDLDIHFRSHQLIDLLQAMVVSASFDEREDQVFDAAWVELDSLVETFITRGSGKRAYAPHGEQGGR